MSRRIPFAGGACLVAAVMASALFPAPGVQAAPQAVSCDTSQLQEVPATGPTRKLNGSIPVVFIHGILSTAAMWDGSSAKSLAGQTSTMRGNAWQGRGPTAWTFNYGPDNLDWVKNQAIGPAFANAVACLARESGHRVVIVAHSMGGLAAQFALAQPDPYGGIVSDHVAELITIGTPYEGSWLLSALQALRTGAQWTYPAEYLVVAAAISSACAGSRSGICGLLDVPPSQVGTALELNSTEINDLPAWRAGLPVYDIAGDIKVKLGIGQLYVPLDVGDVPVLTDSATAHDTTTDGKSFVADCGTESLLTLIAHGSPCYHVSLPSNPEVIQAVLTAIRAQVNDALLPGSASVTPEFYVHTGYEPGTIYRDPNFPAEISFNRSAYISGMKWTQIGPLGATATGTLNTYDPTSGGIAAYPIQINATDPRQCLVTVYPHGYPGPTQTIEADIFGNVSLVALQGSSPPDFSTYTLSPACVTPA